MRRLARTCPIVLAALVFIGAMAASCASGGSESETLTLLTAAARVTNNELRYLHTTWWDANYHYESIRGLEVAIPTRPLSNEASIRPQASVLCATAMMLANGEYDASRVGVSKAEALRRVVGWSNGLAISYDEYAWGKGWQSSLWVYYWAFGSRQVWASLPNTTQAAITTAVATEANNLLTIPPPFYKDAKGTVLYPGDSKSEEDAWNASLLYFAAKVFASNSNAAKWEAQAKWYMLAAYATPSQVGTDPRITGSNLNPDGTVTNHGHIDVDYFACQAEFGMKIQLTAKQTNSLVPWEVYNNVPLVWKALTRLKCNGHTIYRRDVYGRRTADIYYPAGLDYSQFRRFNLAQTDVEVFLQGSDKEAYFWARAHLQYTLAQQARHEDGHTFTPGEDSNTGGEPFVAITGAEMVSRLLYQ